MRVAARPAYAARREAEPRRGMERSGTELESRHAASAPSVGRCRVVARDRACGWAQAL